MNSDGFRIFGALLLGVALAAPSGCARLHGVGASRPSAPVAAVLNQSPQELAINQQVAASADLSGSGAAAPVLAVDDGATQDVAISHEMPPMPQMGANREEALNAIRTKAASNADIKPDIFAAQTGSAKQLSKADQARLEGDLKKKTAVLDAAVSQDEVAAQQADAEWLRRHGASHYQDALNRIEK
jgi:hypothetical protein